MKKTIILLIILAATGPLLSQVTFDYDDAGNRTSRTIILEEKSAEIPPENPDSSLVRSTEPGKGQTTEYSAEMGKFTLKIFPNPNTGFFSIHIEGWDNKTTAEATVTTLTGSRLIEKPLNGPLTNIDFQEQPKGTYLLIVNINGKKETWKIIKR